MYRAVEGTAPDRERGHLDATIGDDQAEGLTFDRSQIDLERRDELAKRSGAGDSGFRH
jgi:hypothetical protein